MLVVDLMHEFELGVWKALFIHLLRILNAEDPTLVHTLDQRYVHDHQISSSFHFLITQQLSSGTNFWQRHYPKICQQHIRVEEIGCPRF